MSSSETKSFTDSLIGMEFVLIPTGEFIMGDNDGSVKEKPEHKVLISKPFHIGKFPVMQSQWERIMGYNPSKFKFKNNPVENVSWYDCIKYIRKLNEIADRRYRLPTEAEWEYACRAGSTTKFFFGNDQFLLKQYAWFFSSQKTHPVGLKQPNAWGLYDMLGNVNEWCWDKFSHGAYSNHQFENPLNINDGLIPIFDNDGGLPCRVVRGGCYKNPPQFLGSSKRNYFTPDSRDYHIGFRLVRTVSGLEGLWDLEYLPGDEEDISAEELSLYKETHVNEGYIYILINPSLQKNFLKIGKTSRDPELRAEEISSGTGVPSPYHVAYTAKVPDCHLAERIMHQQLKDYRVRNEREFFLLPLQKAIDIVAKIADHMTVAT